MNSISHASVVDYDPFAGGSVAATIPITEPQREVWLGDQVGGAASLCFNLSTRLRLLGDLDRPALREALQALVRRHDALRASFSPDGETMCILADIDMALPITDLSALPPEACMAAVEARARVEVETPFELERGPLFRATLVQVAENQHELLMTAHHIICDGWSWSVLVPELGTLYAQECRQITEPMPSPVSFADHAVAQAVAGADGAIANDEAYWLSRFQGPVPVLDLPTDHPRPARRTFDSRREDRLLDATLLAGIRALGAGSGAGLFATLIAGWSVLLSRLCGEASVVLGIPAAGQPAAAKPGLVGHCVNLLPLRMDVDLDAPFNAVIGAAQESLLDAMEHQRVTFGTLLRRLPLNRDPGRLPLVSVMFNLDRALELDATFPGLQVETRTTSRSFDNFELSLNAVQCREGLRLECQYSTRLFDAGTIQHWLRALEQLLRSAATQPATAARALSLVDAAAVSELQRLQPEPAAFARDRGMHEFFEMQCDRTPEAVALRFGGTAWKYAELEGRANAFAAQLRQMGAGRGYLVGLGLERSPDMLAALLGVLKTGAGYVPLDPAFPLARLEHMVADAGLAVLLTDEKNLANFARLPNAPLLLVVEAMARSGLPRMRRPRDADSAQPEDPAYVIYTSGSTGLPKGVQVPHRSVANFLTAMADELGMTPEDRLVAVTTLSFDIAVLELMLPLATGGCVVLAPREVAVDAEALGHLLLDSRATAMQATPGTWQMLVDNGWQGGSGFRILCGGESMPADLAQQLSLRGQLWNLYGPTETTVWSTSARLQATPGPEGIDVHVGRPIANTQVWITDDTGESLLPAGVPGEICIGGDGVTLGYLRRPELTANRFIADHFGALGGKLLYRTGDRGRWRADGNLQHLGRLDAQVKLRGFRIELGEIENRAQAITFVRQSVAVVRDFGPGDSRLILYCVAREDGVNAESVTGHLREALPDYMIPQHIVMLDAIPLLPNGKIDRAALPMPRVETAPADNLPPSTALESEIAAGMAELLGLPAVGLNQDFFASGGHSLLAAQLIARLNRKLDCRLAWRDLFEAPTVARLASRVEQLRGGASAANAKIPRREDPRVAPLTTPQKRLQMLDELTPGNITYVLPWALRLTGRLDVDALAAAMSQVASRQAVLRTAIDARGVEPVQRIAETVDFGLSRHTVDLSRLPPDQREDALRACIEANSEQALDLAQVPAFRMSLYRLGDEQHALVVMAHHILWDGWSFHLLMRELAECYAAHAEKRSANLPALPVQFGDYAAWYEAWLDGPEYAAQREFWRRRTKDAPAVAALPRDMPGRPGMTGHASALAVDISADQVAALRRIALKHDATLFMALLSACYAMLHGFANQREIIIATPVRGRNNADVENLMGFFTSLLPMRLSVTPEAPFAGLMRAVRDEMLDSFDHPDILLEDLQTRPTGERGHFAGTLYHALVSYQDGRGRRRDWGNLAVERIETCARGASEDLGLWFTETEEGLSGQLVYNDEALLPDTACHLQHGLLEIVRRVTTHPECTVATLATCVPSLRREQAQPPSGDGAAPTTVALATKTPDDRERLLLDIFRDVFAMQDIGVDDNFFQLGGTSLLALQVLRRVEQATGTRMTLLRLATGTIASMARELPDVVATAPRKGLGDRLRNLFAAR